MSKDIRSSNVTDLESVGTASATDLVPAERAGRDVYLTAQQIADLGGGGGAVSSVDSRTGAVTLSDLYDASGAAATAQAAAIAASQPLDADLTAIAALTTTSTGRDVLTSANAAAIASKAGLGNVTNTSDANKPVSTAQQTALDLKANLASPTFTGTVTIPTGASITSPVLTTGVSGTAVDTDATMAANSDTILASQKATKTALATKQPLDSDLTTIAGLTATTDNFMVSVASAWASRTPSQVKSTLAIAESDVTNLSTDLSALQTQTALQAAQIEARRIADLGYFVYSGLALTANATPTKLDMAAGVSYQATTELNATAQTAISTTIASMADATNPKWVSVELTSGNVVTFNQGTAAAAPAFPTITATRPVLGFLFIPANATNVDTLLTTNNGLAKLIDARIVRALHGSRVFGTDTAATAITVNTGLLSILASTFAIPANSLNVGDVFDCTVGLRFLNNTGAGSTATTFTLSLLMGGVAVATALTGSLAAASNAHHINVRFRVVVTAIGSGTSTKVLPAGVMNVGTPVSLIDSESDEVNTNLSSGWDGTAAQVMDVQAKIGTTGSQSQTVTCGHVSVIKFPA